MKAERLKILQMLDDGKITADEAAKLLEAVKDAGYDDYRDNWHERFWDEDAQKNWEEKLNKFSQNVENFSKEVGNRLEAAFKEVEPKLRAASKAIVERTAVIVDDISKSLSETLKNMEENQEPCCEEPCCEEKPEKQESPPEAPADDQPVEN